MISSIILRVSILPYFTGLLKHLLCIHVEEIISVIIYHTNKVLLLIVRPIPVLTAQYGLPEMIPVYFT